METLNHLKTAGGRRQRSGSLQQAFAHPWLEAAVYVQLRGGEARGVGSGAYQKQSGAASYNIMAQWQTGWWALVLAGTAACWQADQDHHVPRSARMEKTHHVLPLWIIRSLDRRALVWEARSSEGCLRRGGPGHRPELRSVKGTPPAARHGL